MKVKSHRFPSVTTTSGYGPMTLTTQLGFVQGGMAGTTFRNLFEDICVHTMSREPSSFQIHEQALGYPAIALSSSSFFVRSLLD